MEVHEKQDFFKLKKVLCIQSNLVSRVRKDAECDW